MYVNLHIPHNSHHKPYILYCAGRQEKPLPPVAIISIILSSVGRSLGILELGNLLSGVAGVVMGRLGGLMRLIS
ncbi:hypothetical protein HanXRQr2_Chr09g0402471 [Helianthus annuus]|uniref:Uncharacterized protein n=1 Tax=Helianthus annuus TaxID=4232 RepID=A0A251V9M1_HELAN|nr:hypothetical protein HanXRQr2_Chr09g0402461 [Helianthus annuus]KAF5792121.1 hypothetical protein HanXRQr2_Chr09g0402471 [Helianthus annuus]KAJ0535718.1 hypothetical protein HanIR_Chr09g0433681 [Helianthus annuus]KAJ0894362.1 hypothetical protein HanPSC8_Chr09g0388231 [Helianthus annuus]KAJ0894363.1 hypothetical protein HanPSC8_Chr09g0388241 [Helianthus annuus]